MKSVATHAILTMATANADIALILIAWTLLRNFSQRIRQPPVIGEIIAGIALGPSILEPLPGHLDRRIFPDNVRPLLPRVARVGLMLMIGWEFEKSMLREGHDIQHRVSGPRSHPDGQRVDAHPGRCAALASAVLSDVLAWCMLATVSAIVTAHGDSDLVRIVVLSAVYVAAMFLLVRSILAVLVRRLTQERLSPHLLVILIAGVFLSSYLTTRIGINAIFGAFLFGFVMPREHTGVLQNQLRKPLETLSLAPLPVFFIMTNLGDLSGHNYLEPAAIIVVACAGKLLGAAAPARAFGMPWRDVSTLEYS